MGVSVGMSASSSVGLLGFLNSRGGDVKHYRAAVVAQQPPFFRLFRG